MYLQLVTVYFQEILYHFIYCIKVKARYSVMPNSLWPHGLQPTRLLCPWDFPGKNAGMVAISFSRGSSQPRDQIQVSCTAGRFFTNWATREATHILYRSSPNGASDIEPTFQYRRCRRRRLGTSPGGAHDNPLQYYCLENAMDREPSGLWSIGW